jgi:hypothetical protein
MARASYVLAGGAAALVGWMTACGGSVEGGEAGEGGNGGSLVTTGTGTTTTTSGTGAAGTGTQTGVSTGTSTGSCTYPTYPTDCSQVSYFDCGFEASCQNGTIRADWHEHIEMECGEIVEFWCEYECPYGCAADEYTDWPQDGAELVAGMCALAGSAGSGGAASGSGGAGGS